MSTGYLFMVLGLLSFAMMGIFHKLADKYDSDPLHITLFAMAFAALFTTFNAFFLAPRTSSKIPFVVFLIAILFGIFCSSGFWFFQRGLRFGNIATSWLLINLSSGVPTILSILVYHEPINLRKILVLVLILISMILLWWDRYSNPRSHAELDSATLAAPGEVD